MDGLVPENISFTQWFDTKNKSFQEKYLGESRYKLYKEGKITLSQLVNQKGRTLTIKELLSLS